MKPTSSAFSSAPCFAIPETAFNGLNPTVKKLALVPLMMAGAMSTQAADPSTPPAKETAKPDDIVSLPTVEVEAAKPKELASPKFTQPIIDTPQTVVAIPQEVFAQQGATSLSDVLRNTPGITFAAGEGGSASRTGGDSFYLRGFDSSNSIFIDGVRDQGATTRDTFNVEQVDVVKGPSADNGRGGTAGYVNLETKTPKLDAFRTGTVSYGFDETDAEPIRRATLDINQPFDTRLAKGTSFRLNLMGQEGGVPGRQEAEKNRWSVAPSLALGLDTPTRVILAYQHTEENNIPDYGMPSGILPGSGAHYSPGVDRSNYYGFSNLDHEDITNNALTARIEHDITPDLKLSNQTRYAATDRFVEATSPSTKPATPVGQVELTHGIYETENTLFSNQTNLTADFDTGFVAHTLSTGLEFSHETSSNPTWVTVPNGTANPNYLVDIYNPWNTPQSLLNYAPHKTGGGSDTQIDTGALYAFDTLKLGKKWQVLLGLRLEHYDIDYHSFTPATPAIAATAAQPATATTPATGATAAVAAKPAVTTDLHAQKTSVSWKTGLVFKPRENGSLYATFSTSIRPPGSGNSTNSFSTGATNADNPLLKPQEAFNYELGTKWDFLDQRLLTTVALFRSVNTNVPATDPLSGAVTQSSDQTVDGIELGVTGKITENWLVFAGYAYMHAEVSDLISAGSSSGSGNNGSSLPLLPEQSGNLWTTYRLPFGLTLGGGAQYMGETSRLQYNNLTLPSQVPSYWLFNALASYEVNKHLTLRLNVNNLFDKEYIASLNNNGQRVNLGAPRTYVLSADFSF